jgi:hypothetical protein
MNQHRIMVNSTFQFIDAHDVKQRGVNSNVKTMITNWYHTSPKPNLHNIGIKPGSPTTVCRDVNSWVYMGSLDYIKDNYYRYCPSGTYYLYQITRLDHLNVDWSFLNTSEQIRTLNRIAPKYVKKIGEYHVGGTRITRSVA